MGEGGGVAVGLVVGAFFGSLLMSCWCENDYKNGQIDALTGKIKYELVVQADSTRVWEEKK